LSDQREYELHLRQLSEAELLAEWADLRSRYNPVRTELAQRQIAIREARSSSLRRLVGGKRMRETVAKLKEQMSKAQTFYLPTDTTHDDEERLPRVLRANGDGQR
jgi:hypothetical protein